MKSKYQCTANLSMYDLVGHHNIASTTQGPSACWLQARRLSGEDRWKGAFELRKHKDKSYSPLRAQVGSHSSSCCPRSKHQLTSCSEKSINGKSAGRQCSQVFHLGRSKLFLVRCFAGAVPAAKLLKQAADVLISKCDKLLESLE